jgi:hypothetical protein
MIILKERDKEEVKSRRSLFWEGGEASAAEQKMSTKKIFRRALRDTDSSSLRGIKYRHNG